MSPVAAPGVTFRARARSTNPKHALARRPGPARSLERATRGNRGDGDFGNRRRARTILSNPDYYVARCTRAADRGLLDGTTGVFGHRLARNNSRVPNRISTQHLSNQSLAV